jgi:hypothetical protein
VRDVCALSVNVRGGSGGGVTGTMVACVLIDSSTSMCILSDMSIVDVSCYSDDISDINNPLRLMRRNGLRGKSLN